MINEHVLCAWCHSDDFNIIYKKDCMDVVRCNRCGLLYTNPRPPASALEAHYSKEYFNSWIRSCAADTNKRFKKRLKEINALTNRGRLLDIGCGPGFFLTTAKKNGWDVRGVELSAFAAEYAKKVFDIDVIPGELKQGLFTEKSFNVITQWHVLEHSRDPVGLLKLTSSYLKDGGLLAIEVPNIQSPVVNLVKEKWELLAPAEHLYYFSPQTLEGMLKDAGFKIIKRQTYLWTSPDMIILERLGLRNSPGRWLLLPFIYPFSFLRFKTLPPWIAGDVMIVYARKI